MVTDGFATVRTQIETNHNLSFWHKEGLSVPLDLQCFQEQQLQNGMVVTVIRWRPKKESKAKGEL